MSQQTTEHKLKIRPLGNRILVKRVERDEPLQGGIVLPDSAKKKQEIVEVIAVGPGKTTDDGTVVPIPIKVGDKIVMNKYSEQEVSLDQEEFLILRADDAIAIVED